MSGSATRTADGRPCLAALYRRRDDAIQHEATIAAFNSSCRRPDRDNRSDAHQRSVAIPATRTCLPAWLDSVSMTKKGAGSGRVCPSTT
jgi:hypothetical protein